MSRARTLADMARGVKAAHIQDGEIGLTELKAEARPVTHKQSAEYDLTADAGIEWGHGFSVVPIKHGLKLKCIAAECGYQVGEVIDFPNHNIGVGANNHNIAASADAQKIYVKIGPKTGVFGGGGPVLFIRRDNGGSETLSGDKWKLIIWAEA